MVVTSQIQSQFHENSSIFSQPKSSIFLNSTNNADARFLGFLPSVMSAAIMCIVSKEIEPDNASDYQNQLMNLLKISKVCDFFLHLLIQNPFHMNIYPNFYK